VKTLRKITTAVSFLLFSVTPAFAQQEVTIPQPPQVKITELGRLISGAIGMALVAAALAAFFYLILGGIQWIISGGDKAGVTAAREKITAAFIGLAIVAAAWAIMKLLEIFFGITIISGGIVVPRPYD
jgi:hypothetical protein